MSLSPLLDRWCCAYAYKEPATLVTGGGERKKERSDVSMNVGGKGIEGFSKREGRFTGIDAWPPWLGAFVKYIWIECVGRLTRGFET